MVVDKVGALRNAQCHPGDRLGVQSEPDSRGAHPRPRAHGPNYKSPQVMAHPVCLA